MIRYTLWKISKRAEPDAKFLNRLGEEIARRKTQNVKSDFASYSLRLAAALSALVLSLGLGTSAYAYSADEVTPDSVLYPVRATIENVEEAVAVTPERKQAVETKMIKRRLKEVKILEAKRPEITDEEGRMLQRVEGVLKEGLVNKEEPKEIRRKVSETIKKTDVSEMRPKQRVRVERMQKRLDRERGED
ncbi:MAG: DUF5667 domain-containing protein [Candidatus Uhrbacteria bacterium]